MSDLTRPPIPSRPISLARESTRSALPAQVLVVDDNALIRCTLEQILALEGYEVTALSSAEETLTKADEWPPALALVDVQMEGLSGVELCQRLRGLTPWKRIPILLMSGNHDPQLAHQAREAGANDFLPKPLDLQGLLRLVRVLLKDR